MSREWSWVTAGEPSPGARRQAIGRPRDDPITRRGALGAITLGENVLGSETDGVAWPQLHRPFFEAPQRALRKEIGWFPRSLNRRVRIFRRACDQRDRERAVGVKILHRMGRSRRLTRDFDDLHGSDAICDDARRGRRRDHWAGDDHSPSLGRRG